MYHGYFGARVQARHEAFGIACKQFKHSRAEAIRPGGNRQANNARQMRHFIIQCLERIQRSIGVAKRLEVDDELAGLVAAGKPFHAGAGLCSKVGDGGMCAGSRAFGIAVDAATCAPGTIAVGAGEASVECHLLNSLTKELFEIGAERGVEH